MPLQGVQQVMEHFKDFTDIPQIKEMDLQVISTLVKVDFFLPETLCPGPIHSCWAGEADHVWFSRGIWRAECKTFHSQQTAGRGLSSRFGPQSESQVIIIQLCWWHV